MRAIRWLGIVALLLNVLVGVAKLSIGDAMGWLALFGAACIAFLLIVENP